MARATPAYKRLPGTGYHYRIPPWTMLLLFFVMGIFVLLFRGRRTQLWIGKEHLLAVESDGYTEHYKRFDYRDIQVLAVRKTVPGLIANVLLGTVVLLFIVLSIVVEDPVGRGFSWGFLGFFGLLLLINVLRGPTCQCQIRTAVQTLDLVSLNRLRTARKAFATIKPMIEQSQGSLNPASATIFSRPPVSGETSQPPSSAES